MPPSPWHQVPVAGEASGAPCHAAGRRCEGRATSPSPRRATTARTRTHPPRRRGTLVPVAGEELEQRPADARRAVREPAEMSAVATRGVRPRPAVAGDGRAIDQLLAGRDRVARPAPDRRTRPASASSARIAPALPDDDVGAAVGAGRRPCARDDACARLAQLRPRSSSAAARAAAQAMPSEPGVEARRGGRAAAPVRARPRDAALRPPCDGPPRSPVTAASCARNRPTPAVPS